MKKMRFKKGIFFALAAMTSFTMFSKVSAHDIADDLVDDLGFVDQGAFIQSRTYFGVIGLSAAIGNGGGVNGVSGQYGYSPDSGTSETDYVPSINRNFGFGALVGHREGAYAIEVSYWLSQHTGTDTAVAPTFTDTAYYQSINIDLKRYFFTHIPTQPFIGLGMSFPWILYKGAASGTTQGDDTISGVGLNLSAGMEIYLTKDFSLVGAIQERWSSFTEMSGLYQNYDLSDSTSGTSSLEGDGVNFYAGGTVGFE